jgi:HPt (histidine-containing phosphotransfer) domain-containing protein
MIICDKNFNIKGYSKNDKLLLETDYNKFNNNDNFFDYFKNEKGFIFKNDKYNIFEYILNDTINSYQILSQKDIVFDILIEEITLLSNNEEKLFNVKLIDNLIYQKINKLTIINKENNNTNNKKEINLNDGNISLDMEFSNDGELLSDNVKTYDDNEYNDEDDSLNSNVDNEIIEEELIEEEPEIIKTIDEESEELEDNYELVSFDSNYAAEQLHVPIDMVDELVLEFIEELNTNLDNLENHIDEFDYKGLLTLIHKLKGASSNLRIITIDTILIDFNSITEKEFYNKEKVFYFIKILKKYNKILENEIKNENEEEELNIDEDTKEFIIDFFEENEETLEELEELVKNEDMIGILDILLNIEDMIEIFNIEKIQKLFNEFQTSCEENKIEKMKINYDLFILELLKLKEI